VVIIIVVVHRRLVVHTDAMIQQTWLATQRITESVLHKTNMERSKTRYHHHNCVVIHKSTKNG